MKCKHLNYSIGELVKGVSFYQGRNGVLDTNTCVNDDVTPTGVYTWGCHDCGKEWQGGIFSKSTPGYIRRAYDQLFDGRKGKPCN